MERKFAKTRSSSMLKQLRNGKKQYTTVNIKAKDWIVIKDEDDKIYGDNKEEDQLEIMNEVIGNKNYHISGK